MAKILIVDDDPLFRQGTARHLSAEGHEVVESASGEAAIGVALSARPDIVLLDVMLGGVNGFEVCRQIRSAGSDVPIVFLTGKGEEIDRVVGLELGGDDYMVKPISLRELQVRIEVQLRHRSRVPEKLTLCFGKVVVDFARMRAYRNHDELPLTQREFDLMRYFAVRPSQTVKREDLLRAVWKTSSASTRTVDVHIAKLRQKIEDDPANPRHLLSIWGEGYKFVQ